MSQRSDASQRRSTRTGVPGLHVPCQPYPAVPMTGITIPLSRRPRTESDRLTETGGRSRAGPGPGRPPAARRATEPGERGRGGRRSPGGGCQRHSGALGGWKTCGWRASFPQDILRLCGLQTAAGASRGDFRRATAYSGPDDPAGLRCGVPRGRRMAVGYSQCPRRGRPAARRRDAVRPGCGLAPRPGCRQALAAVNTAAEPCRERDFLSLRSFPSRKISCHPALSRAVTPVRASRTLTEEAAPC